MVCRASRLSSAMVTFARDMSGLEDNQVLGLNHALMQEGSQSPAPSAEQWNALITDVQNRYRAGLLTISPGSHDPVARLEAARTEVPDAQRYYAVQRLLERSESAAHAQNSFFHSWARNLGTNPNAARAEYWQAFNEASDNSRLCASPQFIAAFSANPDNANLAVDRRSLYSYQQMEAARGAALASRERVPSVTETIYFDTPVDGERHLAALAYDQSTGHAELTFMNALEESEDQYYRLSPEAVGRLEDARVTERDSVLAEILSEPGVQYLTAEEAENSRWHYRCATCGQFAAVSHTCPVHGSEEAINRDTRLAVAAARAANTGIPAPVEPEVPLLASQGTMRYALEDGTLRLPGISRVMSEARANGAMRVPVLAVSNGQDAYSVSGLMRVDYLGRGNGYTFTSVDTPGDSGNDHLRCTCLDYRMNLTCQHITSVLSGISALTNPANRPSRTALDSARASVSADLTTEYEASVSATSAAEAGFRPLTSSLAQNHEEFQTLYDEYRDKRTAWQQANTAGQNADFPVPYMRENAFGGLGTRESQRGFGIELEFAFPQDMSSGDRRLALRAIGRELHDLGLTRNRDQAGYGASHGWFRDTHDRGWSFESDPSTGGSDGQHGGEIVSPVMYDEAETWTNIEKVCEVLRRNGGFASKGTGMHVHVSTGDYDHRVENHNRLINSFAENEDLIYRMSTSPERGRHRGTGYCSPNNTPSSPYANVGQARDRNVGHHIGLNLQSVSGRTSDHVEFRTFDGTLEPGVIQAQAAMAVMITEGATRGEEPTNPAQNRNPLGSRLAANPQRGALTGDSWRESTLGFRKFIDKHVPDNGGAPSENPIVRQMVALFAMTKWQKGRRF